MASALSSIIIALYLVFCSAGMTSQQSIDCLSNIGTLSSDNITSAFDSSVSDFGLTPSTGIYTALDQINNKISSSKLYGEVIGLDFIIQVINATTDTDVANLYGIDSSDFNYSTIGDWTNSFTVVPTINYISGYNPYDEYCLRWDAINSINGVSAWGVSLGNSYGGSNTDMINFMYSFDKKSWVYGVVTFSDLAVNDVVDNCLVCTITMYNKVRTLYIKCTLVDDIVIDETTSNTVNDIPINSDGTVTIDGNTYIPDSDGTYTIDGQKVYPDLSSLNLGALNNEYTNITNNYITQAPDLTSINGLLGSIINTLTAIKQKIYNLFNVSVSDLTKYRKAVDDALGITNIKLSVNSAFTLVFGYAVFSSNGSFIPPTPNDLFNYNISPPHLPINVTAFGETFNYDCYDLFVAYDSDFNSFRNLCGVCVFIFFMLSLINKIACAFGKGGVDS